MFDPLPTALVYDACARAWLSFGEPREVVAAHTRRDVLPALQRVEQAVNAAGQYAVGFISYEAAPAFDEALRTRAADPELPLLWFGLFEAPERVPSLPPPPRPAPTALAWTPCVSEEAYQQAIGTIKDAIARGATYQVNYTLRLRTSFAEDPWSFFLHLAAAQAANHAAYLDTGRFVIASASPELFFSRDGENLVARPMKGTAPRGRSCEEDEERARWLQHSEKNRAENIMIVDMIRNDLGRVADVGSVAVPTLCAAERYPTVWQMTSTVTARSRAPLREILRALFPCASITGAPKASTMGIIADLETAPRGVYCGAIGFIAPQRQVQFNVAIRTVVVDREKHMAEYGVGGGIVWDSEAGDEYAECRNKALVLTERRVDFSLLESLLWEPGAGYLLLDAHLDRVCASAAYFGYAASRDAIREALLAVASGLSSSAHKVRLLVARDGTVHVEAAALVRSEGRVRLRLAAAPVDSSNIFLFHKTTERVVYEQARAACVDCDDVVLYNEREEVTEATIANIVIERDGERLTPPVSSGLLAGVFRNWLLAQGQVREAVIHLEDLRTAQHLWVVNSVRRWRQGVLIA